MSQASTFLSGTKVLDLSVWRPGPYATSLLVALGADVIKVEPPGGDPMRYYQGLFEEINAGKRSTVLDLKDAIDRTRALELALEADVVVEGFRPGVMTRLGFDDAAVRANNPGVVYCSISGYGQSGPRATLPGHDVNYQAWGGSLAPEGGLGTMPRLPAADLASGVTAAFGICAALIGRASSGVGAYLDVSMTDVMSTWTGRTGSVDADLGHARAARSRLWPLRHGGRPAGVPRRGQRAALLVPFVPGARPGRAGRPRLRRGADAGAELQEAVASAIARRDRDALVTALADAGVPVAPVLRRSEMVAVTPFPAFPIRLGLPEQPGTVPSLDQHRGQGFHA